MTIGGKTFTDIDAWCVDYEDVVYSTAYTDSQIFALSEVHSTSISTVDYPENLQQAAWVLDNLSIGQATVSSYQTVTLSSTFHLVGGSTPGSTFNGCDVLTEADVQSFLWSLTSKA
jgi:hypothetical protein